MWLVFEIYPLIYHPHMNVQLIIVIGGYGLEAQISKLFNIQY